MRVLWITRLREFWHMATSKRPAVPSAPVPKITPVRSHFGHNEVNGLTPDTVAEEGLSTRLVGIEVEIENFTLERNPSTVWVVTDDGSLRNGGVEYISRPIAANRTRSALSNLLVESLSQECCFSPRTSVHVHVNCQDMDVNKISSIVMIYAIFEKLFYRFAGRGRHKNIFCVPITETNLLQGITKGSVGNMVASWSKYTGLNLKPLEDKGTIEFRQMHGTNNVTKLITWIDLITRLVDFVKQSNIGELRKLLYGFGPHINVQAFIGDVFGEIGNELRYTDYRDIQDNVMIMKQAFIGTEPIVKLLAERDVQNAPYFIARLKKEI